MVAGVVLALALSAAAFVLSLKNGNKLSESDVTTNIETKLIGGTVRR